MATALPGHPPERHITREAHNDRGTRTTCANLRTTVTDSTHESDISLKWKENKVV